MKNTILKRLLLISAAFALHLILPNDSIAQAKKKVLFIGNSYTAYNNLPQLVADVSLSAGDTVIFSSNTPGGYTFQGHSTDATTLALLSNGDWNHVVLQEQSQRPSFPISQVQSSVFPYARALDSIAHALNPCVQSVFYMTWGRKNGDASNCAAWPPVCTYSGMDSLLRLRYMQMTQDNNAMVSPAGAVWSHIRNNLPGIELYQTDESHPSLAGSYATACAFYSVLFRKNPNLIAFDAGLDPVIASQIRQAAKEVAFDSLSTWLVDAYDAQASFNHTANGMQISFANNSSFANDYLWDFGDGSTSNVTNPVHTYAAPGNYSVTLQSSNCFSQDAIASIVSVGTSGIYELNYLSWVFPNPTSDILQIADPNISGLDLISVEGKLLLKITEPVGQIDISALPDGFYILKMDKNRETIFFKILKTSHDSM
ncbi:MAG: PKD domain-containing protein [Bacteroidota bacterium]